MSQKLAGWMEFWRKYFSVIYVRWMEHTEASRSSGTDSAEKYAPTVNEDYLS